MIKMNFIVDINKIACDWLRDFGIKKAETDDDNLIEFLRYYILWMPKIPRKVYISKQLQESQKFKQYEKAISLIRETLEKGKDIMPFASARKMPSKKGGNPYNDDLFNSWGIYHLHLGTEFDESGKIKRSGDLLFCIINSKSAYFIDIQKHKGNWANKELLEIVYDNWKELLEPYELKDMKSDCNYTSKELDYNRKINLNMCATLKNGKSFMIGSFMADGTSTQVAYYANGIIKELKKIESNFKEDKELIKKLDDYSTIKLVGCGLSVLGLEFLQFETDNKKRILITPTGNGLNVEVG